MSASDTDMLSPAELQRLKRATLRHLLDLKVDRWSPRYTELRVNARDRITKQPQRRPGPKFGHKTKPRKSRRRSAAADLAIAVARR